MSEHQYLSFENDNGNGKGNVDKEVIYANTNVPAYTNVAMTPEEGYVTGDVISEATKETQGNCSYPSYNN